MKRFQVFSLNRSNSNIPNEIVLSIGGINSNGTFWKISQSTALTGILNNEWKFFVIYHNREVDVVVAKYEGNYYLKAEIDDIMPNILLSLPESI